ncbi:MAG TPA: beta-eliminating lyase-related protein, partial [Gemmatimonadales bacterium]|nr:beta-eliminating lyase-related protein [Gemmatimonadales bacterium]
MNPRAFASDNNAGVHPEVLAALASANAGHVRSYGHDALTERARGLFRTHFGPRADAWFVFNGTAANVLGLGAVTRPYQAVICSDGAHIHVDECGAPERIAGCKLLPVRCPDGKLRPADLPPLLHGIGDEHRVQPRVLSLTQSTELGTVYSVAELQALVAAAHGHGLLVHLDGARLANAAVSLGLPFAAFTTRQPCPGVPGG